MASSFFRGDPAFVDKWLCLHPQQLRWCVVLLSCYTTPVAVWWAGLCLWKWLIDFITFAAIVQLLWRQCFRHRWAVFLWMDSPYSQWAAVTLESETVAMAFGAAPLRGSAAFSVALCFRGFCHSITTVCVEREERRHEPPERFDTIP